LKKDFAKEMSLDIVYSLSENLVIMSTQMVASVLLLKRQGGISEEELLSKVTWLYNEIKARQGAMTMNMTPSQASVRNALKFLSTFVDMKKDVFAPMVRVAPEYKNIQMLAYYRNSITHLFINECYIATSLQSFGS